MQSEARESNAQFLRGLARAFAGAVIFGLPLYMTMEMWWLGIYLEPWRICLFLFLFFPFLVVLSWHAGFEETFRWRDDVVDALVAYAVGFVSSAAALGVMGILDAPVTLREAAGKLALLAVPGSIGALLAQTQLGERKAEESGRSKGQKYLSDLFIMGTGALFLAFNLAPTEEMILIAFRMTEWHAMVLMGLSIATMHGFVYNVGFQGQPGNPKGYPVWNLFLRFTVAGYALSFLLCAFILWSFGRLDGIALPGRIMSVVVLAFPAAIGAAAARLIL
jgi:putative integral membrane protein (TIGR02587 family)